MPRYFMGGTKYAAYERMMMTPPRHERDTPKGKKDVSKASNTEKEGAEKNAVSSDPQ